ncbi:1-acyl-sn-glycerol-3-phosphate acyltransferase [bacterium]|nr:1-acyl-sn-glycerol-3-phosphate acyltransferase [bacterium]
MGRITRVEVSNDDAKKLRALAGERVILCPNHPSWDPPVIFQLSTILKLNFCYLAAKEVFDNPLWGMVARNVGAYSVNRGVKDIDSQHTTRLLLRYGRYWLVIFPEGTTHHLHDFVLPFLPGVARFGFGALADLAVEGERPPLYAVPVAIRYHYLRDMGREIDASLTRLERKLDLDPAGGSLLTRLDQIAFSLLSINEELYGLGPLPDASIGERLDRLREKIIEHVAEELGVEVPPKARPLRNRLRKLIVAANAARRGGAEGSEYEIAILAGKKRRAGHLREEIERVAHFVAMTGDYVTQVPTAERFLDALGRFEQEVFGRPRFWGPRCATLRIGEPLDLQSRMDAYRAGPDEAIESAMDYLEDSVRGMLDEMMNLSTPVAGEASQSGRRNPH